MMADPKPQQGGLEEAAALANGNQRLTRALTVVALHLTPGTPLPRPEFADFVGVAAGALETLAHAVETPTSDAPGLARWRAALDGIAFPPPAPNASSLEHSASRQFARCATELSAMLLEVQSLTGRPGS